MQASLGISDIPQDLDVLACVNLEEFCAKNRLCIMSIINPADCTRLNVPEKSRASKFRIISEIYVYNPVTINYLTD